MRFANRFPRIWILLAFCMVICTTGCQDQEAAGKKQKDDGAEKKDEKKKGDEKDGDTKEHGDAPVVTKNHLKNETSLYLLMHVKNPVDWYPWGPEALAKAKKENKVIFLSIGYSSCHWCHVMEHESFMDEEIAAFLNQHFVCIKVDREERPDIDGIYMQSLHIFNQLAQNRRGGGWPLSMFLTPEGQPFFGGTYFAARDGDRGPSMGFLTLIGKIKDVWKDDPVAIKKDAATITDFTKRSMEGVLNVPQPLDAEFPSEIYAALEQQFDADHGGFGFDPANPARPKFPEPSNLLFLVDRIQRGGDDAETCRKMLATSLDHMAQGGIRDHLWGGFHRYSVDRFWHIPHFEKMLYDNGQLATVYAEAYALNKTPSYRQVVEEMVVFLRAEMTSPEGAFYTALDADSEGEEGKFYRWTKEELEEALPNDESRELFFAVYDIDSPPNFEEEFYAPQLAKTMASIAEDRGVEEADLEKQLQPIRRKLFEIRAKRERPLTDEKILTSWNGLMIRGLADAGRLLEKPEYIDHAVAAADFVLKSLRTEDGRLQRTYAKGAAKLNAYLNDYAFLSYGLIGLHKATGDKKWLDAAREITDKQIDLFWDEKGKGFYFTSDDHELLLARAKNPTDGAQPSGNSIAALNLVYLAKAANEPSYREYAKETVEAMRGLNNDRYPSAAPLLGIATAELTAEEP
jgi:uncharacterized protein